MKPFTIQQHVDAKCALTTPILMFRELHAYAGNRCLCDTGCFDFKNGSCVAYRRMTGATITPAPVKIYTETVKQEAARRNISIAEVRRQRRGE